MVKLHGNRASRRPGLTVALAAAGLLLLRPASAVPDAHTGADPALRAAALERVSGFEHAPTGAELRALGPGVGAALLEIANDESGWLIARGRALRALGHFPSESVDHLLARWAADRSAGFYLRRAALAGLTRSLAPRDPARAFDVIAPLLRDADFRVRAGAARALADLDDPRVDGTLRWRLAAERHRGVVPTLKEALSVRSGLPLRTR